MANSTVYDVKIQYALDDRAGRGLDALSSKADEAGRHMEALHKGFSRLVELMIGREAFAKGKELFIDFNAQLEQTKISMAAITSYNMGTTFASARTASTGLINDWFKFSESTVLTGKQIVDFGSNVEGAALSAGATLKQVSELAKLGSVVGNVLSAGHAGGLQYVGLEVREALMGNLRKTQMFNMQLLMPYMKSIGKSVDEFNTLSAKKRLEYYMGALKSPAWKAAVDAQANSYEGRLSTLEHKIQIFGAQIGEQLFGALSGQLGEINRWLNEHPKELEAFAEKFSASLMTGFNLVKSVMKTIIDHKDELIGIATVFGALKGAQLLGGAGGGILNGIYALVKSSKAADSSFVTMMGSAMQAAAGLGTLYFAAQSLADYFNNELEREVKGPAAERGAIEDAMKQRASEKFALGAASETATINGQRVARDPYVDMAYGKIVEEVHQLGAYTKEGTLNVDKLATQLSRDGILGDAQNQFIQFAREAFDRFGNIDSDGSLARRLGLDVSGDIKGRPVGKTGDVNVRIDKIEVASDDPDRFVFGVVKAFEKFNKSPTQAEAALRGQ